MKSSRKEAVSFDPPRSVFLQRLGAGPLALLVWFHTLSRLLAPATGACYPCRVRDVTS